MQPEAATRLITTTFDQPLEESQFVHFASNLVNDIDTSKAFVSRHGTYIPQAFQGHIRQYKRPFVYYDPDGERLDVLLVRLQSARSLDRARTMQRNFAAWYLKQEHSEPVEAALVAFYHDDVPDWRFSFVRLEYAFGEEGLEEKLTPARRYSYLVGPNEPTHTAEQQLLPLLQRDDQNPTLDDIAAAFRVEVVSKQFFEAYKELFLQLVEALQKAVQQDTMLRRDFERAQVDLPNFAKKLLGQIVFLYFVQKKGWLGVEPGEKWGSGPRNFLRRLFARQDGVTYDNFFNDVLEPLFYQALAIQRQDDLFTIGDYRCQIPFLNGGLFEPMGNYDWQNTRLLLPNALFSNRRNADDDQGTGILDVFDRYNFTVWEEEPLEKEVAVDPEMLGKVFENLLEVQDRKSKGAFYTPREIVHYMCQESLINYLHTAVSEARSPAIHSPAIHSPAIHGRDEIAVLVRQGALALQQDAAKEAGLQKGEYVLPASVRAHAAALDAALADIKLCDPAIGSGAFPVGMLHEIVQARQALTTYLDDDDLAGALMPRTPYALKRHAIQESIYGVDIDPGAVEIAKLRLWLSLVVDEENYDDIQPLPNLDYKIVYGNSLESVKQGMDLFTNQLYNKLGELKQAYFGETHRHEKQSKKAQIDLLLDQLTGGTKQFDFDVYFKEVFSGENNGFDIVIGNPPYVRHELLKEFKPMFQQNFPEVYAGTADLYVYFYRRGTEMLRQGGTLAFITSNKFMRAGYGKKLRAYLKDKTTLGALIDFGDLPVFDATAYPCIVITQKQVADDKHTITTLNVEDLEILHKLPIAINGLGWSMLQTALRDEAWALVKPEILSLMQKLRRRNIPLGMYVKNRFYSGIKTGLNDAFVIDEEAKNALEKADPNSNKFIKPWLRGRDLKRWIVRNSKLYVIYVPWDFSIEKYPAIKAHLQKFQAKLEKRPEVISGRHPWFAMSRYASEYIDEFNQAKIVYPDISKEPSFAYDDSGAYGGNTIYIIPTFELFLIALLNSQVVHFFYKNISSSVRGGYLRFIAQYMEQIPIPKVNEAMQKELESIVRCLLSPSATISQRQGWEKQVNQLVYKIYNLTPEEIDLIESYIKE